MNDSAESHSRFLRAKHKEKVYVSEERGPILGLAHSVNMAPKEDAGDVALSQLASWLETECQGSSRISDAIRSRRDFLLLPIDTMELLAWGTQLGSAVLLKPDKVCAALVDFHKRKLQGGSHKEGPLSLHTPVLRFEFTTVPMPAQRVTEAVMDMASHPPGLLLRVRGVVHWMSLPHKISSHP